MNLTNLKNLKTTKRTEPLDLNDFPTEQQLEAGIKTSKRRQTFLSVLRTTIYTLITVSAAAVLVATLWMPVLRITGKSMTPTFNDGSIVVSVKGSEFKTGDIIAFYVNKKILIKRVIATSGDWVNIDRDGVVFVNDKMIDEPYVDSLSKGKCNIDLPCQVPEGKYFVMGDHRSMSIDSRSSAVGYISDEDVVGKVVFTIWPLKEMDFNLKNNK